VRKKRQLHCGKCGNAADFYKKGRGHRLLVCPKCGVIASNPLPLAAIAMAAPAILEGAKGLMGGDKKTAQEAGRQKIVTDSLDKPNKAERYVKMALGV